MTFITTGGYWPDADQASGSAFEAEVLRGLRTGGKAVVNGLAIAVVKTLTLGTCGDGLELIGVTEEDRALGYDTAVQFATASGEIFIGVASGNAAAVLQNGGRLARTASGALNILDAAGNVVGVVKGTYDAATNGINLGNGVQIAGSALGLAGNAKGFAKGADACPPKAPRSRGVWDQGPGLRGEAIERRLGHNLPQNYPTIDRFENGVATSIKSMDLAAPSYLDPAAITRAGKRYVDAVAGFQGRNWAGVNIRPGDIRGRGVDIAVPPEPK